MNGHEHQEDRQRLNSGRTRRGFWPGFGAGIGTILLLLAGAVVLIAAACIVAMTRGCGRPGGMMDREMMDGGMMNSARTDGEMMDGGMMAGQTPDGPMPDWMMSREPAGDGMMGDMMPDMRTIHSLLVNHEQIDREVEDIPGGVRTVTTSGDPEIAEAIRRHVWQMKERMEQGRPIRMMDPVFRELFENAEKIEIAVEAITGGVRVTETSDDPQVVALIRQHAHAFVSEVVDEGMPRAMQPTPLPEKFGEPLMAEPGTAGGRGTTEER